MKFADKVVIITGASSGIGEGVAKKFLAEGAKVVGCGVEPEMHIQDENAIYVQADLTDAAQACRVVEEAVKAFGRVNKLVCCAGVTFIGSLETTDYDKFMRELSINLGGVFNMCKAAVVELKKQEGSTIVTVGSDLGVRPIPERIGYCPSKAGVSILDQDQSRVSMLHHGLKQRVAVFLIDPLMCSNNWLVAQLANDQNHRAIRNDSSELLAVLH